MLLPAHSHRSTLLIFLLVTIINSEYTWNSSMRSGKGGSLWSFAYESPVVASSSLIRDLTIFVLEIPVVNHMSWYSGIPSGAAIVNNITIDYVKVGSCNSSIVVRVGKIAWPSKSSMWISTESFLGDFCDYIVTIIIPNSGSGNASTDLSVEIIMPDNDTMVMQMSKPQITYVGGNFLNPSNLYDPAITMTSQLNTSQVCCLSRWIIFFDA